MEKGFKILIIFVLVAVAVYFPEAGFSQSGLLRSIIPISGDFSIEKPEFIFAPALGHQFSVEYDNPREAGVSGTIFDLRGTPVARMRVERDDGIANISGSLIWDGRDSSGSYVSGGVYIYQIEVSGTESKVINGTVVVAR